MVDLALEPDFSLGKARVRPAVHQLEFPERSELLEPRVMQVLVALARRSGQIVTRDELIRLCWEQRVVSDDSINRVISRLRGLSGSAEAFRIETIPRVGYRLFECAPAAIECRSLTRRSRRVAGWLRLRPAGYAGLALAALAGLGSTYGLSGIASGSSRHMALAVLPFSDLSLDQSCSYFGRAVAEEIAVLLAGNSEVRLVAGPEVEKKAVAERSYAALKNDFGVSHVLEGSIRRDGNQVRVTVRLLSARDGTQLWARQYDRGLDDVFRTQREIGSAVAQELSGTGVRHARGSVTDGETYRLFLTARGMLQSRETERIRRARELLQEVVQRDPRFTQGKVWLATADAAERQLQSRGEVSAVPAPYTAWVKEVAKTPPPPTSKI